MVVSKKDLLYFILITAGVVIFAFSMGLAFDLPGGLFFIGAMQCVWYMSIGGRGYVSLFKIYFLFGFIFLFLIPWIQYANEVVFWGGGIFSKGDYIKILLIVLLANAWLAFVYRIMYARVNPVVEEDMDKSAPGLAGVILLGLSLTSAFVLLYLNNFSISQVLLRGVAGEEAVYVSDSSTLLLVLGLTSRLIPFFSFLIAYIRFDNSVLLKATLFFVLLFCVFPTGVPRFMVAFVYLPLALLFFMRLRLARNFLTAAILGLIFIFPFLDQFRRFDSVLDISILPSPDFFYAAHFDAFQNFMRAVQVDFVTQGYQLLGVIFFFVPRSVWSGKPVGSGSELANRWGYDFSNISMPFLGEGYVNFGLIGVLAFAGFLAVLMAWADKKNVGLGSLTSGELRYRHGVYLFCCGALIFLLRGDLLSSFSFFFAGLFSAGLVKFSVRMLAGVKF